MKQIQITLRPGKEHLELIDFVKIAGLAQTGGQAGQLIKSGSIKLNNQVETRKKKKLNNGDIVVYKEDYQLILE